MERLFGLDFQLIFDFAFTAIAVFLLFLILSYVLFDPVQDMLKKRQDMVQMTKDIANREKEDAMALKADYEEKVKNAETEAEELLSQTRKSALKKERAILEEAKETSVRIMENANVQIELEKKRAMEELKQEVIAIAAIMAEKVLAATMNETRSNQLIEDALTEMGDETWRS